LISRRRRLLAPGHNSGWEEGSLRIAIMGSGGVGGYFGARLAKGGADVTFIARGAHLAAMRTNGLAIDSAHEPLHLPKVNATDNPRTIGPVDMVLFSVKLWDTESAARSLLPIMTPQTGIISFQNGVQKDDTLRQIFGADAVMGGVAYMATTIGKPGVIAQTGTMQRMVFGEYNGKRSARAEALLAAGKAGGINAELSDDIRRAIWEKFCFLVGLSGSSTSIRTDPRQRAHAAISVRSDARDGCCRTCPGREPAGGLCHATARLYRWSSSGHDLVHALRPHARPAARSALAQRWRCRNGRKGRRADAGQSRGLRRACVV
jgi:ketopantoate reductase